MPPARQLRVYKALDKCIANANTKGRPFEVKVGNATYYVWTTIAREAIVNVMRALGVTAHPLTAKELVTHQRSKLVPAPKAGKGGKK